MHFNSYELQAGEHQIPYLDLDMTLITVSVSVFVCVHAYARVRKTERKVNISVPYLCPMLPPCGLFYISRHGHLKSFSVVLTF